MRLANYDYQANGYYFVTVVTRNRLPLLGSKECKPAIEECIKKLPEFISGLSVDYFVVMDNHIHVIFVFNNCARPLGRVVSAMKSAISKIVRAPVNVGANVNSPDLGQFTLPPTTWQRNYYEHVIRNETVLSKIREYIHNNPEKEKLDFEQFYGSELGVENRQNNPSLAYQYKDALYLNITSRCPTACEFCIKFSWNYQYRGINLLLKKEPSVQEILDAAKNPQNYAEIVFCGYGESTYRLKEMEVIAYALKEKGAKKIRLNTIGLGNLIHKRNIVPDLAKFLDCVSISLNTADPQQWIKIHRPLPDFREKGFESVLDFISHSAKVIPETVVTAVERSDVDLEKVRELAEKLGAQIRIRPYLDETQNR